MINLFNRQIAFACAVVLFQWSCGDLVAEDLGFGYVRRGEHIYFEGNDKTIKSNTRIDKPMQKDIDGFSRALDKRLQVCKSPDATTFEALSEEYTRDKNMVYYKWISPGRFLIIELPQADVATFKAINSAHGVDKNTIWYMDNPIRESDPVSVELLDDRVIKDFNHVYISGEPQLHLDAKTFRHLASGYYIDSNGAYWGNDSIAGADLETFKVLDGSFVAVDKKSVYRSGERQPHLDAATCKLIMHNPYGYQVVSDKNGVYLNNLKFLHADPDDFTMIDKFTAKGGKYIFLIDTWHSTPVTLYKDEGRLIVETVLYEKNTINGLAVVKAEVAVKTANDLTMSERFFHLFAGGRISGKVLKGMTFASPPGKDDATIVPDWQIKIFQREDLIERMSKAAELLE